MPWELRFFSDDMNRYDTIREWFESIDNATQRRPPARYYICISIKLPAYMVKLTSHSSSTTRFP